MGGLQSSSDVLDLAKNVPMTADSQVWGRVAGYFNGINAMYGKDETRRQRFANFAIARLSPKMAQIGWTAQAGEADVIANLRSQLIVTLAELGDKTVIAEARRRYAASATDPQALPAPLRSTITYIVAQHADAATWESMRAMAASEKTPMIKDQMYSMLASPRDEALARRALEMALTEEPGLTNSAGMISQVAGDHPDLAFDFALAHIDQVNDRVDSTSRSRFFPRLGSGSANPEMIAKLRGYADKHLAPSSRRDVETAVASITYRIKVRNERLPAIDTWLDRNAK
jgi:puromycin-sensitive aminopeptidase